MIPRIGGGTQYQLISRLEWEGGRSETKQNKITPTRGEIIGTMKNRDASRHPGIMRVMRVDSEFAGILVAVGFLVMGAVGLDIGRWFVLGALGLGVAVALLLRFTRKSG